MNEREISMLIGGLITGTFIGLAIERKKRADQLEKLARSSISEVPDTRTLPPPPRPEPLGTSADFSPLWDALAYDVDVFPASAGNDATVIPPPAIDGVSAAPDCSIVAVGPQWWDEVGEFAADQAEGRTDGDAVLRRVALQFLPQVCRMSTGEGATMLRLDIAQRLKDGFPDLEFSTNPRLPIQ